MIRLADPAFLLLLALLPGLAWLRRRWRRRWPATLVYSDLDLIRVVARPPRWRHLSVGLRLGVLALTAIGLARPQSGFVEEQTRTEGVDIMMALDVSGSMAAEDFRPRNRLHVAKQVVADFIDGRRNDRVGLVVFAEHAFTRCPLTLDHGVLRALLDRVELAPRGEDGTAIGTGLAAAVNRLRASGAGSRVVVLITDGRSNRGRIDPGTAAEIAAALGIRVHTIGVGTEGMAPFPVEDRHLGRRHVYLPADLDEGTLKEIAAATRGEFFRATDPESLATIFRRIDAMEKTELRGREHVRYAELFPYLLTPAGLVLGADLLLRQTRMRRIP